jgi:two-component sensor histidine kinase
VFYNKGNTKISLIYLDSIFQVLKSYNNISITKKALNLKAKSLLIEGKYKEANSTFDKFEVFTDSIDTQKAKKDYLIGVIHHETELRTNELEESRLKSNEETKTIYIQKISITLLGLILLGSLFFFYKTKKKNKIIRLQQVELNETIQEKEVLIKEIHHRVKNNLQVVSGLLQINSKKKTSNFNDILLQSQRQINSMSLVHEMLYQKDNLTKIHGGEYLKKLTKSLLSSYPQKKIKTQINAANYDIHIDIASPLGLILNELITNSMKHGFKNKTQGEIIIELKKENGNFTFTYFDNGIGVKNIDQLKVTNSFGYRLIKSLSEEIKATFNILNDNGLKYIFKFLEKKQ